MKEPDNDKVMTFDALFTTNHIQMLKILLASVAPPLQKSLAVWIKVLELRYTIRFFQQNPHADLPFCRDSAGLPSVLEELLPFCSFSEKEKMQNFRNIYQKMENMQEMMQMMEMLQEISPELFSQNADSAAMGDMNSNGKDLSGMGLSDLNLNGMNLNGMDLSGMGLKGMDLRTMAELLQGMFAANTPE